MRRLSHGSWYEPESIDQKLISDAIGVVKILKYEIPSRLYARSLYESLDGGCQDRDGIIKNFWRTVVKNGDESRIENIVKLFEELVVKNSGGKMVEVETARPLTAALDEKIKAIWK